MVVCKMFEDTTKMYRNMLGIILDTLSRKQKIYVILLLLLVYGILFTIFFYGFKTLGVL